jgi:hypothetical protein
MLEIILIVGILFLILTFFYKQAVCEFRLNQIEWSQKDNVSALLNEKLPLVIRSLPSATFWTHDDVLNRTCFKDIPIFQETTLTDWISTSTPDSLCPWKYPQAEIIASEKHSQHGHASSQSMAKLFLQLCLKISRHPSLLTGLAAFLPI